MAVFHQAIFNPTHFWITHIVVMTIQRDGVVPCLEGGIANDKPFTPTEMHSVFLPHDEYIINQKIFKGANLNTILSTSQIQTLKMGNPQILHVEECKLTMESVSILESAHIHPVHNDPKSIDTDVLVVSFCNGPLVQQHMGKGLLLQDLFQINARAELQRGIASNIDSSCNRINSRLFHHDRAALIDGRLQSLGVLDSAGLRRKTISTRIGNPGHLCN